MLQTGLCAKVLDFLFNFHQQLDDHIQLGKMDELLISENYLDKNNDILLEVVAYENMVNEQLVYFQLDGKRIISRGNTRQDIEIGKIIPIKFQDLCFPTEED